MKVKIVKANSPTYWYATEIGRIFDVVKMGDRYEVADGRGCCIDLDDAEVVPEKLQDITIDLRGVTRTTIDKVCNKLFNLGISFGNYEKVPDLIPTPLEIRNSIGVLYITQKWRKEGHYGLEWNDSDTNYIGEVLLSVTDVLSGRNDELLKQYAALPAQVKSEPAKKVVNCKIDLSWVKAEAREVIFREIQKKLFAAGATWNSGKNCEGVTLDYIFVVDDIITHTKNKAKFDGLMDGNWYTKEQLAMIPEVSVNNALKGKFWTYSNVPKKEEAPKPTRYKVSLTPYVGKARVAIAKAVQEEAFKKGFKWNLGKTPMFTGVPYLFFETVRGWITYGMLESVYNGKNFKELTVEEILSGALPQVK